MKTLITEELLQFLWQYRLFNYKKLKDNNGNIIEILSIGTKNYDAGPDFLNARIRYNNLEWVGNVEIHVNSEDWFKHNHHLDPLYNSVILHIVFKKTVEVKNSLNSDVLTVELPISKKLISLYKKFYNSKEKISCKNYYNNLHPTIISSYVDSLIISKLENKSKFISTILNQCKGNWEEVFYRIIAYGFGLKLNSLPFLMLAENIPLTLVKKHIDNELVIKSIFFGQSNLLPSTPKDNYTLSIIETYKYYKKKYNLTPLERNIWRFSKLYPSSYPTLRIAKFVAFLIKNVEKFSDILKNLSELNLKKIRSFFDVTIDDYWKDHYNFNTISKVKMPLGIGRQLQDIVIINSFLPFIFAYSLLKLSGELNEKVLSIYEKLKAEKNHIIREWEKIGFKPKNSLESQALIYLYENYCKTKQCFKCNIGAIILTKYKSFIK